MIFGAVWILLGKRVWFFPNILVEEATLSELFRVWPKNDEEERPKWTARIFYAIVAVLAVLLLRHHAPDEAAQARYHKRVSNIIEDVLEWSPTLALTEMMENIQTVVNTTETGNNFTDGSNGRPENVAYPGAGVEENIMSEHQVDEDDGGNVEEDKLTSTTVIYCFRTAIMTLMFTV